MYKEEIQLSKQIINLLGDTDKEVSLWALVRTCANIIYEKEISQESKLVEAAIIGKKIEAFILKQYGKTHFEKQLDV